MEINEALPEYKRFTYADYCTWGEDTVPVHVLEGCVINLPEVFPE